ncbi:MAG: hypothetical protein ACOCX4_08275, partial [Planctomycetota bacterium]
RIKGPQKEAPEPEDREADDFDIDLSGIDEEQPEPAPAAPDAEPAAPAGPPPGSRSKSTAVLRRKRSGGGGDEGAGSAASRDTSASRRKRSSITKKLLGNLLVKSDAITEGQLQKALDRQAETGGLLGQILVAQQACAKSAIGAALNKQRTITTVELPGIQFDPEALALVSRQQCEKHRLVPFEKIGQTLCIAMSNVLDSSAKNEIRDETQLKLKTFDAAWPEIEAAIAEHYAEGAPPAPEASAEAAPAAPVIDLGDEEEDVPVIDLAEEDDDIRIELPDESAEEAPVAEAPAGPAIAPAPAADDAGPSIAPAPAAASANLEPIGVVSVENGVLLQAVPVSGGFYRRVVQDGAGSVEARWLAERAGLEVLPAVPTDANGSAG